MNLSHYNTPSWGCIMISQRLLNLSICSLLVLSLALVQPVSAQYVVAKMFFDGGPTGTSTTYGTNANWGKHPLATGTNNVIPNRNFQEKALIGFDDVGSGALLDATVTLTTAVPIQPGGVYLGTRGVNFIDGSYLFADPAPGALVGRLTISNGRTLTSQTSSSPAIADGRVIIGREGRGELRLDNGNLTIIDRSLSVGGEEYTDPNGIVHRSLLSLKGTSELNITGTAVSGTMTLGRDLRIEGPSATFHAPGNITLESGNSYTAVITSPTTHSVIDTDTIATIGGSLNVEFSGAGASGHVIGQTWNLVHADYGITGGFTNLIGPNQDVPVSGLLSPQPSGTAYRLRTDSGPGELEQTLKLVYVAVPEPSAVLLGLVGGLALLRRRGGCWDKSLT